MPSSARCGGVHQPPGQRQRKPAQNVSQTSPDWKFPQGHRVSVPDRREGQPTIPRRRQEVCACADRPAEAFFLFGPCTARFSFGKTKREMGGALGQACNPAGFPVRWDGPQQRKRTAFRRSKHPLMPWDGLSDTHPSAGASPHGCRSGWTRCPHGPASPVWSEGPRRSPGGGRRRNDATCGA